MTGNHNRQKILVVDNDKDFRNLVTQAMSFTGNYEIVQAADGLFAMQAIQNQTFDLILLDIEMPGVDGRETCRLIRSENGYAETPIILISAHNHDELQTYVEEAGANAFLSKPFSFDALRTSLSEWLESPPIPE